MTKNFIPHPDATGIARVYRDARDLPILRDDANVFPPDDHWTLALAEAIVSLAERGELNDKKILELGSGSGVNMLGLHAIQHFFTSPPTYLGLDITCEAVEACQKLAKAHDFEKDVQLFQSNLLSDVEKVVLEGTDIVFACLPQVVWDYEAMGGRGPQAREFADYYVVPEDPKEQVPEDVYGLGLLARALDQIREKAPKASVLFNIAARQGQHADRLFEDHGFTRGKKIVNRIIPHDPGTALTSFRNWEQASGETCRFYSDESGRGESQISAEEAEQRRINNEPLYHELSVVLAEPAN